LHLDNFPNAFPEPINKYFEFIFRKKSQILKSELISDKKFNLDLKKFIKILKKLIGISYADYKCLHGKKNSGKDF